MAAMSVLVFPVPMTINSFKFYLFDESVLRVKHRPAGPYSKYGNGKLDDFTMFETAFLCSSFRFEANLPLKSERNVIDRTNVGQ